MFAEVVFPNSLRRTFTYSVPEHVMAQTVPGVRVWVPLRNKKEVGLVAAVHFNKPEYVCRPIDRILDETPIVTKPILATLEWMSKYYFCGLGECAEAALPLGFQTESVANLVIADSSKFKPDAISVQLKSALSGTSVLFDEIKRQFQLSDAQINKYVKSSWLRVFYVMKDRVVRPELFQLEPGERIVSGELAALIEKKSAKLPIWLKDAQLILRENWLPVYENEIVAMGVKRESVKRLIDDGFIDRRKIEYADQMAEKNVGAPLHPLNDEQERAFYAIQNALEKDEFESFLLKGITGSGKTEVYIHALHDALKRGKGGIVLVPEIALTPQTVRRFKQAFGNSIAVLHSRLTNKERFLEWFDVLHGKKNIVIGARSAVFAPVQDLGLIIIDEEHDASYKQADPAPRYHAREVAHFRARLENAVVLCGSATPSINALDAVERGKMVLLKLNSRHSGAVLPDVHVIDLKQYKHGMRGPLSAALFLAVEAALGRDEQVILLYNRRGFSNYVQCKQCGDIPGCPNCSVSLTYHKNSGLLRCHYCGFAQAASAHCNACKTDQLAEIGSGTQKVEEEIAELFPDEKLLRFDLDAVGARDAHEQILGAFARKESRILIGTQLVAKGLDFPDVTVVGILNADTELAFPSYRTHERWFQMLSQVSGRAGRSGKKGVVFMQTWRPDDDVIRWAARHNFDAFARYEMENRKMLMYPPFSRLIKLELKSEDQHLIERVATHLATEVERAFPHIPLLGPTPSAVYKRNKFYYWEMSCKLPATAGHSFIEMFLNHVVALFEDIPNKQKVMLIPTVDPLT